MKILNSSFFLKIRDGEHVYEDKKAQTFLRQCINNDYLNNLTWNEIIDRFCIYTIRNDVYTYYYYVADSELEDFKDHIKDAFLSEFDNKVECQNIKIFKNDEYDSYTQEYEDCFEDFFNFKELEKRYAEIYK